MALTENGNGVRTADRGRMVLDQPPAPAPGSETAAHLIEDGFCVRNSGRPDIYEHGPGPFSGPATTWRRRGVGGDHRDRAVRGDPD